ncbi:hypothetical protein [Spirosoma pollinicola]|uniref:hypothetical protein n=1 Tax=Spirosoma pollinicola TaxID=2057025 RepID=UPI0012FD08B9|nr:hypothetical protein [Spirosoma pollinicola]
MKAIGQSAHSRGHSRPDRLIPIYLIPFPEHWLLGASYGLQSSQPVDLPPTKYFTIELIGYDMVGVYAVKYPGRHERPGYVTPGPADGPPPHLFPGLGETQGADQTRLVGRG